jgi:uncharacterized protein
MFGVSLAGNAHQYDKALPMRSLLPSLALAITLVASAILPASAQDAQSPQRTLTLTGEAQVRAAPDMATISTGIVTEADSARAALDANNTAMRAAIGTITAAGVQAKDVQTSNFSIQPKYNYRPAKSDGSQEPPSIVGYTVSNNVTVIVRDLAKVGGIMDAVVTSGVNHINGIDFSIANPEPLLDEARRQAVAATLARAKLYAEAAGVTLGPIMSISENSSSRPPRPLGRMAMQAKVADSVPVAEGEQVIESSVNIVWEIR